MGENKEYEIPEEVEKLSEELSGGYFNFRLVEKEHRYGEDIVEKYYEIHEVYYRADDSIWAWSTEPVSIYFENFEDATETIRHIAECCEKTVLRFKDENKEEIYDTGKKIDGYKPIFKK